MRMNPTECANICVPFYFSGILKVYIFQCNILNQMLCLLLKLSHYMSGQALRTPVG
jgi:hypothetical protein